MFYYHHLNFWTSWQVITGKNTETNKRTNQKSIKQEFLFWNSRIFSVEGCQLAQTSSTIIHKMFYLNVRCWDICSLHRHNTLAALAEIASLWWWAVTNWMSPEEEKKTLKKWHNWKEKRGTPKLNTSLLTLDTKTNKKLPPVQQVQSEELSKGCAQQREQKPISTGGVNLCCRPPLVLILQNTSRNFVFSFFFCFVELSRIGKLKKRTLQYNSELKNKIKSCN